MQNQIAKVTDIIANTPPAKIAELDLVKDKFIKNYNACHRGGQGELAYHRELVHFNQLIAGNDKLRTADKFSLYACFVTAAVNGYSLDPLDNEVYIIPRGGKACISRQAGAHVKRLIRTNQIKFAEQAKLVFEGDDFKVQNGRVIEHIENFISDTIKAGYVRFVLDDNGADRYFIYRKSDWESWRRKSQLPNGDNWAGGTDKQPIPGFLRTKLVLHACNEKCWATGSIPPTIERFEGIEIDDEEAEVIPTAAAPANDPPLTVIPQKQQAKPQAPNPGGPATNDHFAEAEEVQEGVTIQPDDEEAFI
jgi:recombinational DNA repair protein RecT